MSHPTSGMQDIITGCKLLLKPGIKRFVVIPLLINILLFTTLLSISSHYIKELNHWLAAHLPSWLGWATVILWILFFISFFLVILYTFTTLANIISAPFNSLLSEKIELHYCQELSLQRVAIANTTLADIPRIMRRQLGILSYYLPRAVLIFILFFIPILQVAAPVVWFLFNAWFMTLQYVDYPADNHRVPLKELHRHLKQHYGHSLSFGVGVLILSMIPIINFITMPAAVAGATVYWIRNN